MYWKGFGRKRSQANVVISPPFAWKNFGKPRITHSDVPAVIRTGYLPNTSQKRYRLNALAQCFLLVFTLSKSRQAGRQAYSTDALTALARSAHMHFISGPWFSNKKECDYD
jgi:hypothetical protein